MNDDTDRLNFLLRYFSVDDVGDEFAVPGVVIKNESLEDDLTWGTPHGPRNTRKSHFEKWDDDMRDIIDKAIKSHEEAPDGIR